MCENGGLPWALHSMKLLSCGWVVAAAVLAAPPVESRPEDSASRIAVAKQLMLALYSDASEFDARNLVLPTAASLNETYFGAWVGPQSADPETWPCRAIFYFSERGLEEFNGGGACVQERRNRAFQRGVEGWPDAEIAAELVKQGAVFGPTARKQVAAHVPSNTVVSGAIGTAVEFKNLKFLYPAEWEATYTVRRNRKEWVQLSIEPFSGHVTGLRRFPMREHGVPGGVTCAEPAPRSTLPRGCRD